MNQKEKTYRVGLFKTIILGILIVGHLWLSRFEVARKGVVITVYFDDISGLKLGDPVLVFGVNKGKVIGIKMLARKVEVKMWISKDVDLREDTKVSIKDVAMISGTKCVILDPGKSPNPLDISKPLQGEPSFGLTTVEIGKVAEQIGKIADFVKGGMGEGGGVIRELRENLSALKVILKENRKGIKKILSQGGKDAEKLEDVIKRLDSILTGIEKGRGTAGKLLNDEKLYNNMNLAVEKLIELIEDIKKNPSRYIKVNVKVF